MACRDDWRGLTQSSERGDVVAGSRNARDRLICGLDDGSHVMGVGMNDGAGVAGDRDMPIPEYQIAAFEFFCLAWIERSTESVLLHVAVARAGGARRVQGNLDEARTIDSKAALAAPQIGRANEALGDLDEIRGMLTDRTEMPPWHVPTFACYGEGIFLARNRQQGAHHQRLDRRQLDRGARKSEAPQRCDRVGRGRGRRFQHPVGQPSDIAIAFELAPGPAFTVALIDRDALALECLGRKFGIGEWRVSYGREGLRYFEFFAHDKALGLDLAFEMLGGDVASHGGQARIIHSGRSTAGKSRARPGTRRLRGAPVSPMASSRKYRHAASF